jgi:hypothetical protein
VIRVSTFSCNLVTVHAFVARVNAFVAKVHSWLKSPNTYSVRGFCQSRCCHLRIAYAGARAPALINSFFFPCMP